MVLRFADAHVGDHQPTATVRLRLQRSHFSRCQRSIVVERIDDQCVVVRRGKSVEVIRAESNPPGSSRYRKLCACPRLSMSSALTPAGTTGRGGIVSDRGDSRRRMKPRAAFWVRPNCRRAPVKRRSRRPGPARPRLLALKKVQQVIAVRGRRGYVVGGVAVEEIFATLPVDGSQVVGGQWTVRLAVLRDQFLPILRNDDEVRVYRAACWAMRMTKGACSFR